RRVDAKGFLVSRLRLHHEFLLDYVTHLAYMICILAQEGRLPETIAKGGARSGVPRLRANRKRGRSGPRPPGIYGLARTVAAAPVCHWRSRRRGSRPKIATVERRE